MTVIRERRRDGDVIGWLLVLAFGAAAWRGASDAPVLAAIMAGLGATALGAWIRWRCRPRGQLTITPAEITWGRPGHVHARIPRTAAPLAFRRSRVVQSGWWLSPRPSTDASGISLLAFDLREVREACTEHGWDFAP